MAKPSQSVLWHKHPVGHSIRYRLSYRPDGEECFRDTPWFIDRDPYDRGPDRRSPYGIWASGMSTSRSAGGFGNARTLAMAKARVLELAELDAQPVDRVVIGNHVFMPGDRVTFRAEHRGFGSKPFGRIVSLLGRTRCVIRWDGEEADSEQHLPKLMLAPAAGDRIAA